MNKYLITIISLTNLVLFSCGKNSRPGKDVFVNKGATSFKKDGRKSIVEAEKENSEVNWKKMSKSIGGLLISDVILNVGSNKTHITTTMTLEKKGLCKNQKYAKEGTFFNCTVSKISDRYLLTAGHCIEQRFYRNCSDLKFVFGATASSGDKKSLIAANENIVKCKKVYALGDNSKKSMEGIQPEDFAIIEIEENKSIPNLKMAQGTLDDSMIGETVRKIGHGLGIIQTASEGKIKQVGNTLIKFDADILGGDSGAPVFNDKGEIIAVVSSVHSLFRSHINIFPKQFLDGKVCTRYPVYNPGLSNPALANNAYRADETIRSLINHITGKETLNSLVPKVIKKIHPRFISLYADAKLNSDLTDDDSISFSDIPTRLLQRDLVEFFILGTFAQLFKDKEFEGKVLTLMEEYLKAGISIPEVEKVYLIKQIARGGNDFRRSVFKLLLKYEQVYFEDLTQGIYSMSFHVIASDIGYLNIVLDQDIDYLFYFNKKNRSLLQAVLDNFNTFRVVSSKVPKSLDQISKDFSKKRVKYQETVANALERYKDKYQVSSNEVNLVVKSTTSNYKQYVTFVSAGKIRPETLKNAESK
jgi:V8-like Glu-specific endopeptidase